MHDFLEPSARLDGHSILVTGGTGSFGKRFIKTVLERIESVIQLRRDKGRKKHYLHTIKERNRAFLEQYRAIRADLEAWLQNRGVPMDNGGLSSDHAPFRSN